MLSPLSEVDWFPLWTVFAAALAATFTDVRTYKIYNLLTIPLIITGLLYHMWFGGLGGLRDSGTGIAVGFAVLILPYLGGAIGAGDVKLLMGFGAWLGVVPTAVIALVGCLLTGLCAATILVRQGGVQAVWFNALLSWARIQTIGRHLFAERENGSVKDISMDPDQRHKLIPFSVMLVAGLMVLTVLIVIVQAD